MRRIAALLVGCGIAISANAQEPKACKTIAGPALPVGVYVAPASEKVHTDLMVRPAVKPSAGGALQVRNRHCMRTLSDAKGDPIQLRGMSTHGLQWFGDIVNPNAFAALSKDWGSNLIRLALYVGEGGYASKPELMQKVQQGIDLAIANDMYVMVDWHVLQPGDPSADVYKGALEFFTAISKKYPNNKHIIYELANEPNLDHKPGVTNDRDGWLKVKAYAEPIISMLRSSGNQNVIVVGSPNWSQRPDLAAADPIRDSNVMYSVHFYAGTHMASNDVSNRGNVMSNARYALENGVAVFVTEWGSTLASGDGGPFFKETDGWIDFMNKHNLSWANWSLGSSRERSAAFPQGSSPAAVLDPGKDLKWDASELSVSGEYTRSRIKGVPYVPVAR